MIRQAVILAAGLGTRLRPVTNTIPKVMLPILGKPLLEWHIEQFKKHGVAKFFIETHYLPEVIKNHFGDGSSRGVRIHYLFRPVLLGTTGGVKSFEDKLDDAFFVIYGDILSLVDYTRMAAAWAAKPPDALGMQRMAPTDDYADADVAEVDADGRFIAIHTKPHARTYPNAYRMRGIFILRKKILSYAPEGVRNEISKELLPDIVARGLKFYSYECDDYSKGIDTAEKWQEVESYLKEHAIAPWW